MDERMNEFMNSNERLIEKVTLNERMKMKCAGILF